MEREFDFAAAFDKLSLAATPIRAATPFERRTSAVCQPESHPVSPAGSEGGSSSTCGTPGKAGADGGAGSDTPTSSKAFGNGGHSRGRNSPPSPPAFSHFSIPAYREGSLTPAFTPTITLPREAPSLAEERITFNLFVDGGSTPHPSSHAAAEEALQLRRELEEAHAEAASQREEAAAAAAEQVTQVQREYEEQAQAAAAEAERLRHELSMIHSQVEEREQAAAAVAQQREAEAAAAEAELARMRAELAAQAEAAEELAQLRKELDALRSAAAGTVDPEADAASRIALVINVAPAEHLAPEPLPAVPAVEAVQLVINVEAESALAVQHSATPDARRGEAGGAAAAELAALQQQLARAEACREELARQAGQLKGRIAKLEGAALAGESRVKAQASELESLRASHRELEAALAAAQAQVGVTPDRARAEMRRLAEAAAEAQAAADMHAERAQRLAQVLSFEEQERQELSEFAALEHQLLAEAERGVAAEAAQWRADAGAATAQLADARQRLVDMDAALLARDEEVRQLRAELEAAQAATEAAAQLAAEWRQRAEQYDRDRHTAAANIRKAERELELVAQDNERTTRQLNFVRTRLMAQLGGLDMSVPDIGKLARELQSWCDREAAQRLRPKA